MALDTANKRESAVYIMSPWRTLLQFPTGTVVQGNRQASALAYSGILASGGASYTRLRPIAPIVHSRRRRRR